MLPNAQIELPPKLIPVFEGDARYRGAYGGRGSGKTRSFAKMAAVRGYKFGGQGREGQILCAREFMNSLDESSLEEVKAAIRSEPWLEAYYEIGEKFVRSRDGRIRFTFAGLSRNVDSIKSKARILLCWVDEAEHVAETSWQKLIPTVREEQSEVWVTWNPESKRSPAHQRFREDPPEGAKIVQLNWRDNPWFPAELELERVADRDKRPHLYDHIWEGDFVAAYEGAYYAALLREAHREGRIGNVSADPLMQYRHFWDIGGTGARADATSIWVGQFIGKEVRLVDYYEAQGQPMAAHVEWMRERKYTTKNSTIWLPHDGDTNDRIHDVSVASYLRSAGFSVEVVPNQGRGAARHRIEALRRLFPSIWFDDKRTEAGREALAWYHEKRDEDRGIGLGPEHDWSSHAADAAGLMAVVHAGYSPRTKRAPRKRGSAWAA